MVCELAEEKRKGCRITTPQKTGKGKVISK
jgi:hypothetical protein